MAKLDMLNGSYGYLGAKIPAAVKTKGVVEVLNGVVVFPYDNTVATQQALMVHRADGVECVALVANTDLAQVNFVLLAKVYWDPVASKFTNLASGNIACGRSLENKNLSAAVNAGDKHYFELTPDVL
jgi:hypothetical protein